MADSGHTGQHAACRLCRLRNLPTDHTVTVPLTVTRPEIRTARRVRLQRTLDYVADAVERAQAPSVDMETEYLRNLDQEGN